MDPDFGVVAEVVLEVPPFLPRPVPPVFLGVSGAGGEADSDSPRALSFCLILLKVTDAEPGVYC